jgi:hypothetical protein
LIFISIITNTSVDKETSKAIWRRDCKHREATEPLGCIEHKWRDGEIVVDECICNGDFCNTEMGPIPETTTPITTSTTTRSRHYSVKKS